MNDRKILVLLSGLLLLGALLTLIPAEPSAPVIPTMDATAIAAMIDREEDHLTPAELDSLLASDAPMLIVDLRDPEAYQAGHVPGAVRASVAELLRMTVEPDRRVIVYSNGGIHAGQAWVLLKASGHRRAFTLLGGWNAWHERQATSVPKPTSKSAPPTNTSREREKLLGEC